jgi:hypothetical protein
MGKNETPLAQMNSDSNLFVFWLHQTIETEDGKTGILRHIYSFPTDMPVVGLDQEIIYDINPDNILEWCKKYNNQEAKRVLIAKQQFKHDYKSMGKSPIIKSCLACIDDILFKYITWFRSIGMDFELLELTSIDKPLTKKEQFDKLFISFYEDRDSNPEYVKKILQDKDKWKNPSAYLHKTRKNHSIQVNELKSHPAFNWVDPKNTSVD